MNICGKRNKGNNHKRQSTSTQSGNSSKLIVHETQPRRPRRLDPVRTRHSTLVLIQLQLPLLLLLLLPPFVKGLQYEDHIQRFSIHGKEDCSDVGEFYTSNIKNLMLVSELVQCGCMKCFCVWHGMWIFTTMRNYQRAFTPENTGMNQMSNPGKICESRKINWHYLQLHSIRHVGNVNDSLPGLSLFRDVDFFGRELYLAASLTPGSGASSSVSLSFLSLPSPKLIKSYGLTGRRRWTIFANTNFTGNSTCVTPIGINTNNAGGDTEIKTEAHVSWIVGSVQTGCVSTAAAAASSSSSGVSRRRKFHDQENLIALYTEQPGLASDRNNSRVSSRELKLVFDGEELRLTSSTRFRHYSVIGSASWTIYSGTEYNGKCECLLPPGQLDHTERKREFTGRRLGSWAATTEIYYETMPLPMKNNGTRLVGSIRRGCFLCRMPFTDPAHPVSDEYNELSQEDYEDSSRQVDVDEQVADEIVQVAFAEEELAALSNGTDKGGVNGTDDGYHRDGSDESQDIVTVTPTVTNSGFFATRLSALVNVLIVLCSVIYGRL